jgi:acyl-CoA thioester hydrolase
VEVRVYYEDTDTAGVVYHSNYLNFMERARTELFRSHGLSVAKMAADGFIFPVVKIEVLFKYPAVHDDLLLITTAPLNVSGSSFMLRQQVLRQPDKKLIVDAAVTLACINASGRPKRIPLEISTFLKNRL